MIFSYRGAFRLRHLFSGILVVMLALLSCAPVAAQSNSAIAQQFQTKDSGVTATSLVSNQKGDPNSVMLSSADSADQLAGVVSSKALIELSDGGTGVQVVTSGLTNALVSDLNGSVVTGDKITASPVEGVGMRVTDSTVVVGTAQASLSSVQTETREITDTQGKKQTIHIGVIPVQVSVAFYSVSSKQSAFVPPFLQSLANSVTGREVSPVRVLVAALILLLLFLSITVLLYSSVRSSIISIGRNPLSESAVRKSLLEVGLTVFAVLLFAVVIVYLVLTV